MPETDAVVMIVVGGAVLAYQAFVSLLLWQCRFFESKQRWMQLALIWFLPVLGALVCHAVVQSHSGKGVVRDSLVRHYDEADEYVPPRGSPNRGFSVGDGDADGDA